VRKLRQFWKKKQIHWDTPSSSPEIPGPLTLPTPQNFPSLLEGGMDIFWNYTNIKSLVQVTSWLMLRFVTSKKRTDNHQKKSPQRLCIPRDPNLHITWPTWALTNLHISYWTLLKTVNTKRLKYQNWKGTAETTESTQMTNPSIRKEIGKA